MKTHEWHRISPDSFVNEEPAFWRWCSYCGSMQLGTEVYYLGSKRMVHSIDKGCPDVHIQFNEPEKKNDKVDMRPEPTSTIDPFELPTESK